MRLPREANIVSLQIVHIFRLSLVNMVNIPCRSCGPERGIRLLLGGKCHQLEPDILCVCTIVTVMVVVVGTIAVAASGTVTTAVSFAIARILIPGSFFPFICNHYCHC